MVSRAPIMSGSKLVERHDTKRNTMLVIPSEKDDDIRKELGLQLPDKLLSLIKDMRRIDAETIKKIIENMNNCLLELSEKILKNQ